MHSLFIIFISVSTTDLFAKFIMPRREHAGSVRTSHVAF